MPRVCTDTKVPRDVSHRGISPADQPLRIYSSPQRPPFASYEYFLKNLTPFNQGDLRSADAGYKLVLATVLCAPHSKHAHAPSCLCSYLRSTITFPHVFAQVNARACTHVRNHAHAQVYIHCYTHVYTNVYVHVDAQVTCLSTCNHAHLSLACVILFFSGERNDAGGSCPSAMPHFLVSTAKC